MTEKSRKTSAELQALIRRELKVAGVLISVFPDLTLGWHAVAYTRASGAAQIQARVDEIARQLRTIYDLKPASER